MLLLTTETRREQRELYFLPDRETAIGQEISALRARSSRPVAYVESWNQTKELWPQAEALFPGRRLPAREKSHSSVFSVPLW
jgi:hypothetical protein